MKFNVKASLVAGTVALTGLATGANAALVSYSESFNFGETKVFDTTADGSAVTDTQSKSLTIDGFDSSLGTLNSVYVSFATDWELTSKVLAADPNWFSTVEGTGTASSEMSVTLTNPVGATEDKIEARVSTCSGWNLIGGWCWEKNEADGTFNGLLDTSSIATSSFIDTILEFDVTRTLLAELTDCEKDDWCALFNKDNSWGGSITVAYDYDPGAGPSSSVPEPAMLAVFGLGLLGFSAARRRKA